MKSLEVVPLKEKDRAAVRAAAALLRAQFPVDRIVLFGSKARGDDDPESDIDLLILTRESLSFEEQGCMRHALYDLQCRMDVFFSKLILSSEEWDQGLYQVLPIHLEVERDGIDV